MRVEDDEIFPGKINVDDFTKMPSQNSIFYQ